MTYTQLIRFFKTPTKAAKALNCSQPTLSNWKKRGISRLGQLKAQKVTCGFLKADPAILG
jgi:hypothetical protein